MKHALVVLDAHTRAVIPLQESHVGYNVPSSSFIPDSELPPLATPQFSAHADMALQGIVSTPGRPSFGGVLLWRLLVLQVGK